MNDKKFEDLRKESMANHSYDMYIFRRADCFSTYEEALED